LSTVGTCEKLGDLGESNNHVVVGKEYYFLSGDGYLMPTRKDQPPPDPRYFKTAK